MKKIIAALLLFIAGCGYSPNPFEIYMFEGIAAYAVTLQSKDGTSDTKIADCPCKGTKKVKSGDGLQVINCPCGDNCKCGQDEKKVETRQLLLYTDPVSCPPCRVVEKEIKKLIKQDKNWRVSDKADAHIRILPPAEGVDIPTLILVVNGKEEKRWVGSDEIGNYDKISNHYYGR